MPSGITNGVLLVSQLLSRPGFGFRVHCLGLSPDLATGLRKDTRIGKMMANFATKLAKMTTNLAKMIANMATKLANMATKLAKMATKLAKMMAPLCQFDSGTKRVVLV